MTNRILFAAASLLLAFGCSSSSSSGDAGAGGSTGAGASGNNCPAVSTTDGSNSCNANTCVAGEYCAGVNCLMGCEANGNCAAGQLCDLTTSTMGFNGKPIGTCRVPATCGAGAGGSGTGGSGTTGGSCLLTGDAACVQCGESSCGSNLSSCLGPGYASGNFSGTCGAFATCASACGCSTSCIQGCQSQMNAACGSCLTSVNTCISGMCSQQCNGTGAGGTSSSGTGGTSSSGTGGTSGGMSCTALVACCKQITDSGQQMQCAAEASSGSEQLCAMALTGFQAQNLCQ